MTVLDWVLVVVWAGIALAGFFKGAVRIVFGLGGLVLGIWLSLVIGRDLAAALAGSVATDWLAFGLGYLIPLVVVSLLCALAGWGLEKTLEGLKLGCLNRGLGMVVAGGVAAAVLAILLVTAVRVSPGLAAFEERSLLLARVESAMGLVVSRDGAEDQEADGEQTSPPADGAEEEPAAGGSSGR